MKSLALRIHSSLPRSQRNVSSPALYRHTLLARKLNRFYLFILRIQFGSELDVYLVRPDKTWKRVTLDHLLPMAFTPAALEEERAASLILEDSNDANRSTAG